MTSQTKTASGGELPAIPGDHGRTSRFVAKVGNRFVAWLVANAADIVILCALGALTVLVRVLLLDGVDTGGDAIEKWHFVRQWFYRNSFHHGLWNHHMARVGVNAVIGVAQLLFGRGPGTYYVVPVFAALGESCFVYACGKRLESRLTGVLAALLLIFSKTQIRAGSQVMPEIFSGLYAIMTAYVFLRYADAAPERKRAWLIAMGVAAFISYLGKETSVFFFPGFAVGILLVSRKLRDVFIFGAVFAAGVVSECLAYTLFTDYKSRWQIILGTHVENGAPSAQKTFWQLFERFSHLDEPWKIAFYMVLPCCIGIVALRRDRRAHAIVAMEVSYVLLLTFLVRQVRPVLVIWQSFYARYLDPTAPFTALIIALFAVMCFRRLMPTSEGKRWAAWLSPRPHIAAAWVVGVCALSGLATYLLARPEPGENVLVNNAKIAAIVNDTYRRNLPLIAAKDVRGMWAVYNLFLDDRLLARKGILPLYDGDERAVGVRDDLRLDGRPVLVKNPREYDEKLLRRLRSAYCYTEVSTEGGRSGYPVRLRPFAKLPPECDEELYRHEVPNN